MRKPLQEFRLDGRIALVTAAGRGIGRVTAQVLAEAGALVIITDIQPEVAARVADAINASGSFAESCALDVADEASVASTIADIAERHHRIDVLVNNAGISSRAPSESFSTAEWERVTAVNMTGSFRCARETGRHMLQAGRGAIVNVSSIMGLVGGGLHPNPAYHATKGALVNWTRALAIEWAPRGIRVNAVAPAYVSTASSRAVFEDPQNKAVILNGQPIGRLIEPKEVANAILFLASDAASAITGITLPVDGGWTAR